MLPKFPWQRLLVGTWSWRRLLLSLAFIYVGVGVGAWFISDRLIFPAHPPGYVAPAPGILMIPTADGGRIAATYRPNPRAAYTLLYSHGNGPDLSELDGILATLHDAGFAVFAYDYRGYGASVAGPPSAAKACRDIEAAYAYLTEELKVPPERIILYGYSVGTGPSVYLAARRPVAGLILESPFVSTFRVMTKIPLFPVDKLRNLHEIKRVHCPILVLHGTRDTIIPFWHGQQVFAAAPEPKMFLPVAGAGHCDVAEVAGPRYQQALHDFTALLKPLAVPASAGTAMPKGDTGF
jgi:fermentation-respiration switch protein FrsA (DUF1100 family)